MEDSGIEGTKIKYSSYENEVPIISSGVNVGPWKKLEKNIDRLPEIAKGNVYVADIPDGLGRFYTMYDGYKRIPVARKDGFDFKNIKYERAKSMNVLNNEDRYLLRKLEFEGGVLKNWKNLEDIEVGFAPVPWTMNLLQLESVNEKKRNCLDNLGGKCTSCCKKITY